MNSPTYIHITKTFFADQYTTEKLTDCSKEDYGAYDTLSEGIDECESDSGCDGVYCQNCNCREGGVHLCPKGANYETSSSSCVHKKRKIYVTFNLGSQHNVKDNK